MTRKSIKSNEPFESDHKCGDEEVEFLTPSCHNEAAEPICRNRNLLLSPTFISYRKIVRMSGTSSAGSCSTQVNGLAAAKQTLPSFREPDKSCLSLSVSDRMTFVLPEVTPPPQKASFPVLLHVYDLSRGFIDNRSEELLGFHVSGLYHSAVVYYGMEFFFGGGIAIMGAGRTRFGKKYERILVGTSTTTLSEFMLWIRQQEKSRYNPNAYHPTKWNCHDFSNDAVRFLVGENASIPSYLSKTTEDLIGTKIGASVAEVLIHYTKFPQKAFNRIMQRHKLEKRKCFMCIAQCALACELHSQPPACVVLFRVEDAFKSRQAFERLVPYVEQLRQKKRVSHHAKTVVISAFIITTGVESVDSEVASDFVELIACILLHTHTTLWGPVLNALRIALLHKVVLCASVFHPTLLCILANGIRDFLNMTSDGRLALLRVLCNLSSGIHGALALTSTRFGLFWVSVVGLALIDYKNTAIVYTGAALALNLAHALVWTKLPQLHGGTSVTDVCPCISQLITILLFFLQCWPSNRISEPAMNMMLLALFFLMSNKPVNMEIVATHDFRLDYKALLSRAQTNETKAILCLMHALEQP